MSKKLKYLMPFFASVFISKTSSSLGTQSLELEDRHVEKSKASVIQPATALRHTEGDGAGWDPKGTEEAREEAQQCHFKSFTSSPS